jgi:hypothetical protein
MTNPVYSRRAATDNVVEGGIMSFGIYLIGYLIFSAGVLVGAYLLHVPPKWIGVAALILIGLGVLSGVTRTRTKDVSQ